MQLTTLFFVSAFVSAVSLETCDTCSTTEVCRTTSINISCDCAPSINCTWKKFADWKLINTGIDNTILLWDLTINGSDSYGQYDCIRNSSTVVKSVLIFPSGREKHVEY